MKRIGLLSTCITAVLLMLATSVLAAETIRYNGSSVLLVSVIKPLTEAFTQKTGVEFDLKGKNTWFGLDKLVAGECDISGAGSNKIDKYQEKVGGSLKIHKFAQEGVAIAVNAMNPIENISMIQLTDTMSGKTRDWADLGWPQGKKIFPVACAKGTAQYTIFTKKVLKDTPYKDGTIYAKLNPEIPEQIAKFPGTIGYGGLSTLAEKKGVKVISLDGILPTQETINNETYPIKKTYFLITKGELTGSLKEFIDFCNSPEGLDIIVKSGLLTVSK